MNSYTREVFEKIDAAVKENNTKNFESGLDKEFNTEKLIRNLIRDFKKISIEESRLFNSMILDYNIEILKKTKELEKLTKDKNRAEKKLADLIDFYSDDTNELAKNYIDYGME